MKVVFINLDVVKNNNNHRFELTVNGFVAFIDFVQEDKIIKLIHTESPAELAGQGAATAVIEKTLEYLETNHLELVPLCPLVFSYIKKHPEWKRIVVESFKSKF